MNPIAVALDLLLAALLLAALALGARLNARLKTLRDGQAGFAAAVLELNQAASRAQAGLADLRAASEDTHDALLTRIETARALVVRLEQATLQAEKAARLAASVSPVVSPALPPHQVDPLAPTRAPRARTSLSHTPDAPLARGSLAELAASLKARLGDASRPDPRPDPRSEARPEPRPATPVRAPRRPTLDDDMFEGEAPSPGLDAPASPGLRRQRDDRR